MTVFHSAITNDNPIHVVEKYGMYTSDNLYEMRLGRDKKAAIYQTTFSNAFFWMQMFEFWLRFHWILSLMVQLAIFQDWFR